MKKVNNTKVLYVIASIMMFHSCKFSEAKLVEEWTENVATRTDATNLETSYSSDSSDNSSDTNFISSKYSSTTAKSWGCHDPKLFQDTDGTYYVYSTGWTNGVELRYSEDLIHWTKRTNSPLWDTTDFSILYNHMQWDDDFLKWVGYAKNNGTSYDTTYYTSLTTPNSWAPTVVEKNGKYYMFHGIITDCLTYLDGVYVAACITLAISDNPKGTFIPASTYNSKEYSQSTLVRYVWQNDKSQHSAIGYDGCYNTASQSWNEGFGAIDPEFVYDISTGELKIFSIGSNDCYAITYGSWKGGIAVVFVDSETFKPVATVDGTSSFNGVEYSEGDEMDAPLDSIEGNEGTLVVGGEGAAYEGSQIVYNNDTNYYYAFVSMGDLTNQYRVGVGRSSSLTGDYKDTSGRSMKFTNVSTANNYHLVGGKIIGASQLGSSSNEYGWRSPGGQSILRDDEGRILFACHSRTTFKGLGNFCLQIRQMFFNQEGWPVLNQNEFYGEDSSLDSITLSDLSGTYDSVLTVRTSGTSADGSATSSKTMTIFSDGTISGDSYSGSIELGEENGSVIFNLENSSGLSLGTFYGFAMNAIDWAKKDVTYDTERSTFTFTTVCSDSSASESGEYFFGNRIE